MNATDTRLAQLLLEDAPPERDARFRIALLERRERQLYRQRSWRRAILCALCAVLPGVALLVLERPLMAVLLTGLAVALVVTGLRVVDATRQAWRWVAASGSS